MMRERGSPPSINLPTIDEIGAASSVQCSRMRRESDRDYAHRLALHLQERIIEFEQLLTACLAIKVNRNFQEDKTNE